MTNTARGWVKGQPLRFVRGHNFNNQAHVVFAGEQYGRLTVVKFDGTKSGHRYYECQCDCGNTTVVQNSNLRTGHVRSCGCLLHQDTTRRNPWTRLAYGLPAHVGDRRPCSIDGCDGREKARGWCHKHYVRWMRYGDPLAPVQERRHGDDVGYSAVHNRLRKRWEDGPCAICGEEASEWAYDHADPDERIGTSGGKPVPYSVDMSHYFPACHSCHTRLDAPPPSLTCKRGHPRTRTNTRYRRREFNGREYVTRVCIACEKRRNRARTRR